MYLDSAIIVKLLVREADSHWFVHSLPGHSFECSEIALTEVCAALLFKERKGEITPHERVSANETFFSMVKSELILLFPLNRDVCERARSIQLACHPHIPLRSLDALHVATCDLHHGGRMSATDGRIRSACKQLGIALTPETMEELTQPK